MRNKLKTLALASGLAVALAGTANAQVFLDNWTLDLTSKGGPQIDDILSIDWFQDGSISRSQLSDGNGNGIPDPGETYRIVGGLAFGLFVSGDGAIAVPGLNSTFEITALFDVTVVLLPGSGPGVLVFDNVGGSLEIFYDDTVATFSDPATGDGYNDGDSFASFNVVSGPNDGGGIFFGSQSGSEDAFYSLTAADMGVILDGPGGNDIGVPGSLIGFTTEILTLNQQSGAIFDITAPSDTTTPFYDSTIFPDQSAAPGVQNDPLDTPCSVPGGVTGSACDFWVLTNGTANIQEVPEPATLGLMGMGLLGLGVALRRRRKAVA